MDNFLSLATCNSTVGLIYSISFITSLTVVSYFISRKLIPSVAYKFIQHTKKDWLHEFKKHHTFRHIAFLVPVVFIYFGFDSLQNYFGAENFNGIQIIGRRLLGCWVIFHILLFINAVSDTVLDIYNKYPISSERPIKNFIQLIMLIIYVLGGISILALLMGKDPAAIIGMIGGASVILGLIFKDSILSFIAGIQITTNKLVENGDWIEMPQYGANGTVIEIALHVIKVQNFDKTIITIPTYKFIEEGFKNWKGMYDAGGRRIMRSLPIDQNTVKFLNSEELEKVKTNLIVQNSIEDFQFLSEQEYTNLGLFRYYVEAYLEKHPKIRKDLTFLIRLLDPTATGVPLELYIFTNDTDWVNYEKIQADIFEHLTAIMPVFGLRIYQRNKD